MMKVAHDLNRQEIEDVADYLPVMPRLVPTENGNRVTPSDGSPAIPAALASDRGPRTGRPAQVVIIGGGFAGLAAARALRRSSAEVTIVDRVNHHTFQPLLYQVATAGLSAPQIASPIRHILRKQRNVRVVLGEVTAVDVHAQRVQMLDGELSYDFLIVAAGLTNSYFGHPEWALHAPALKTLDDALAIRRRILLAFERAERELEAKQREAYLTFIIIGGGPTGVELAGTLAEIARHTLSDEFRRIVPASARVLLLEGGSRILSTYTPSLSEKAVLQLAKLGVEVRVGARVTNVDATGVTVEGEGRIEARTVLWAAGVRATALVDSLLRLPAFRNVFIVGDLALLMQDGQPVPGVGYAAKQMGESAGRSIARAIDGRGEGPPFRFRDLGALATIGRGAAVAQFPGGLRLSGRVAWWAWLFVHIFFLIGFRNRIATMIDWAWSYFTYQRHARLILGGDADPARES